VEEHGGIVSTNRVEFIISTLKITRSTDESYLRSQTALPFGEALFGIRTLGFEPEAAETGEANPTSGASM